MKTYEIVETVSGKIVETVETDWNATVKHVAELNKQGKGVFARKPENNTDLTPKRSLSEILKEGVNSIFVDCWTSGNPGKGGYRGVTSNKEVLFSKDSVGEHTNNFFELYAILAGLEYVTKNTWPSGMTHIIYSDSKTALNWITSGQHNATKDQDSITKLIEKSREILRTYHMIVSLDKFNTELYGEIPADFNRK